MPGLWTGEGIDGRHRYRLGRYLPHLRERVVARRALRRQRYKVHVDRDSNHYLGDQHISANETTVHGQCAIKYCASAIMVSAAKMVMPLPRWAVTALMNDE